MSTNSRKEDPLWHAERIVNGEFIIQDARDIGSRIFAITSELRAILSAQKMLFDSMGTYTYEEQIEAIQFLNDKLEKGEIPESWREEFIQGVHSFHQNVVRNYYGVYTRAQRKAAQDKLRSLLKDKLTPDETKKDIEETMAVRNIFSFLLYELRNELRKRIKTL
jgi:hypothetical protein